MHVDWDLFIKYFQKRCSEEELKQIEIWRNSDPDHQSFLEEMKAVWGKSGNLYPDYKVDHEKGWKKLSDKLEIDLNGKNSKKRIMINGFLRWSAILILFITAGWIVKIMLFKEGLKTPTISVQTANNINNIVLSDSSSVTLNCNSVLRYPKHFSGRLREVFLKGTAFFNISPDSLKPFVVNMGNCAVKVMGTSFYINSDSVLNTITLIVSSGKVCFYNLSVKDSSLLLTQNEKAVYHPSANEIVKETGYNRNEIAWKTGDLIFEEEKLLNVCLVLSSHYSAQISLQDTTVGELRLTASFHNQDLLKIIETIKTTLDIDAVNDGNTIIFFK